jgi:hypothetical protein
MPCEQKVRLLDAYRNATKHYSFAVDQLQSVRATASKSAYEDARRISEEARMECNAALMALEEHILTHDC